MSDKGYLYQLERYYKTYLKRVIEDLPFKVIELRGGKNRPESTIKLAKDIEEFQKFEKRSEQDRGWSIKWEDWNSKKLGKQKWPSSISIETEDDYLYLTKKEAEVHQFKKQLNELIGWRKEIRSFLLMRPNTVLEYQKIWTDLCYVADYLLQNDVRNYYIRSIPLPVHTKFIENNKAFIYSLLKHFSPERYSDESIRFEAALGLREKQHVYTMRWLDDSLAEKYMHGHEVFGLSTIGLKAVQWEIQEIWLVENETNLYLLPKRKGSLVLFSKGHAVTQLFNIPLFTQAKLVYWGDLDEHGFIMLNSFRKNYGHANSIFMDKLTVEQNSDQMLKQPERYKTDQLDFLTDAEIEAFMLLKQSNGRIEQETLNQEFMSKKLSELNFKY